MQSIAVLFVGHLRKVLISILAILCWIAGSQTELLAADTLTLAGVKGVMVLADEKFQRDRQAILAMAGNYRVNFRFRETVSFAEEYKLKEPYEPDGYEIVRVIQDEGTFVSLQHILVVDGIWDDQMPIKHWRQDWVYEPRQIFEYSGHHVWQTRTVNKAEAKGKWGQLVFQVDDSPRYAAVAAWNHQYGESSWTSPPTWRPLPRRERTKRNDYDVLVSVNRHALTPVGWVHEQDSSKVILQDPPRILARERGVNTYTASAAFMHQVADTYWDDTKVFWEEVRDEWSKLHGSLGSFKIFTRGKSGKRYNQLLVLAKDMREGILDRKSAVIRARQIIRTLTTRDLNKQNPLLHLQNKQLAS